MADGAPNSSRGPFFTVNPQGRKILVEGLFEGAPTFRLRKPLVFQILGARMHPQPQVVCLLRDLLFHFNLPKLRFFVFVFVLGFLFLGAPSLFSRRFRDTNLIHAPLSKCTMTKYFVHLI